MKDFHQIQITILQKLLYSNGLKYSQFKPKKVEGSKFTFHLEQLTRSGYVAKQDTLYELTSSGKELANRMDLGDEKIVNQAKVSVLLVCTKEEKLTNKYLLYTRLKSPFYGYQGFPTGKVKRGEDILGCARRELKEETGLVGTPKLFAIRHYKIFDLKNNLLEDKIFFACKFINPKGKLKMNSEGIYKWVDKDKVWDYLKKPVKEIEEILEAIDNKEISFLERSYSTKDF